MLFWTGPKETWGLIGSVFGMSCPSVLVREGRSRNTRARMASIVARLRRGRGLFKGVVYGVNMKLFDVDVPRRTTPQGMGEVYERSNRRMQTKYGQAFEVVENQELPTQRPNDLAGVMGILEKIMKLLSEGRPDSWLNRIVIFVTDGGKKTRFATKILSEGYAGLSRLPGHYYENIREFALVNTLELLDRIPGGLKRFLAWTGSDNMLIPGDDANIGGVLLSDTEKIHKKIVNASVVKGGRAHRFAEAGRRSNHGQFAAEWRMDGADAR